MREVRFPNGRPVGPADGPDAARRPRARAGGAPARGVLRRDAHRTSTSPLDPQGSPFQLAAWRGLLTIPFAETVSYGEQARRLGHAGKARAIGAANGSNPIPVIVPCHRVVGSDGSLTGFGGGLETKAWLLHHERRVAGLELPL